MNTQIDDILKKQIDNTLKNFDDALVLFKQIYTKHYPGKIIRIQRNNEEVISECYDTVARTITTTFYIGPITVDIYMLCKHLENQLHDSYHTCIIKDHHNDMKIEYEIVLRVGMVTTKRSILSLIETDAHQVQLQARDDDTVEYQAPQHIEYKSPLWLLIFLIVLLGILSCIGIHVITTTTME